MRIDYLVGSVQEREPNGVRYTEQDYNPDSPKGYLAKLGHRLILSNSGDVYFPTAEEAAVEVELAAIATAHEILNELEPA